MGATPFAGLLYFTVDPYLILLSVKQGDIKYNFLSLWYDSTWNWTQDSQAIDEHSNHHANKKRTCRIVDLAVPADHRVKMKDREKKDKYLDLARELKKLWNMNVTVISIVIGALGTITKRLVKGLEELEISGRVETIQTAEIGQNTEKSPGDLRRLDVTQIRVKDHQLTLMWKTLKE